VVFDAFDVVVVPFPFTDRRSVKRRPALVLSRPETFGRETGHSVLAMITSQKQSRWSLDVPITDGRSAGLDSPSTVRMKLFTLDHRLVLRKAGRLAPVDRGNVIKALGKLLPLG
jgi:mRNA interferase MazF